MHCRYAVTLFTPIGRRYGTLELHWEGTALGGSLSLFNHERLVTGTRDEDGTCRLWGEFVTLLHTFSYRGEGVVTRDGLNLVLYGDRSVYRMEGVPQKPQPSTASHGTTHEKAL